MKVRIAAVSILAVAATAVAAAQAPAKPENKPALSPAGRWNLVAEVPNNPQTSTLDLKADAKDAKKFAGVLSGQSGEVPITAEMDGPRLTMWLAFPSSNGNVNITFTGAFKEDGSLAGTLDYGQGPIAWSATRVKNAETGAAAASLTGPWVLSLQMSQGAATPALELKQDGTTLTGTYTGRYGAFPLQGTVKGRTVEFGFSMSADGTPVQMGFKGEVAADGQTMKGTASLGELGEAAWSATRQKRDDR